MTNVDFVDYQSTICGGCGKVIKVVDFDPLTHGLPFRWPGGVGVGEACAVTSPSSMIGRASFMLISVLA